MQFLMLLQLLLLEQRQSLSMPGMPKQVAVRGKMGGLRE
jgi:hypothetical protein